MAFVHAREELGDLLGRVLQIGVEGYHALAAAALEAGHDRHVLTEVAVQKHHAGNVRPSCELLAQERRRAVATAIVDENNLVRNPEPIERRIRPREERAEASFFVVNRDDDREIHKLGTVPIQRLSCSLAYAS